MLLLRKDKLATCKWRLKILGFQVIVNVKTQKHIQAHKWKRSIYSGIVFEFKNYIYLKLSGILTLKPCDIYSYVTLWSECRAFIVSNSLLCQFILILPDSLKWMWAPGIEPLMRYNSYPNALACLHAVSFTVIHTTFLLFHSTEHANSFDFRIVRFCKMNGLMTDYDFPLKLFSLVVYRCLTVACFVCKIKFFFPGGLRFLSDLLQKL